MTANTQYTDYFPDYTEEDLEAVVSDQRFIAAAHAYSLNLISLGLALSIVPRRQSKLPSPFAFTRLFHEVAVRINDGRLALPPNLRDDHPDTYDKPRDMTVLAGYEGLPFSLDFEELNRPDEFARYLALRRWKFNEFDIEEMIKNEFFLACVDSWRKGLISGGDAREMLFPDAKDLPRDLSESGYLWLQTEVTRRIIAGEITLPSDLPAKFPIAYQRRERPPRKQ